MKNLLNEQELQALRTHIAQSSRILICAHRGPDGDAVGSSLGWAEYLRQQGKQVDIVMPTPFPDFLRWMPGSQDIRFYARHEAEAEQVIAQADLIFCLDFNTLKRIDKLAEVVEKSRAPRILVDHHLDPDDIFAVKISFPHLSSTCEVVYRLLYEMALLHHIDTEVAQCLYLGMMTDTGNFTYSSEYPEIYEIVAQLMRYSINKQWLYNMALNTFSEDSLRLQGYAMSEKMEVFPEAGAALITLTANELERFHYAKGDTEGLVNKPLCSPRVQWVMFLREDPDKIKVSCRSQGDFSVSDICAKYFGGGGHKNAAGGDFFGTMDEAVAVFHQLVADIAAAQQTEQ